VFVQTHLAHLAASRHARSRSALSRLVRFILVLPLAAFWATLSLAILAATLYGWYAAATLLLRAF
jgi:hypothetical protein